MVTPGILAALRVLAGPAAHAAARHGARQGVRRAVPAGARVTGSGLGSVAGEPLGHLRRVLLQLDDPVVARLGAPRMNVGATRITTRRAPGGSRSARRPQTGGRRAEPSDPSLLSRGRNLIGRAARFPGEHPMLTGALVGGAAVEATHQLADSGNPLDSLSDEEFAELLRLYQLQQSLGISLEELADLVEIYGGAQE